MPVNSRQKGKRGELDWCRFLRSIGFHARRTQQFAGADGTSDAVSDDLPNVHMEVKLCEQVWPGSAAWGDAIEQAQRDSLGRPWCVAHRQSRRPWMLTYAAHLPPVIVTTTGPKRIQLVLLELNDRTGHLGTGL